MNRTELISVVAEQTATTKKDTAAVVEKVFEVIANTVAMGDKVAISGFGTFSEIEAKARTSRNPRTGEIVEVPAKNKMKFSVSKTLKESLN